jgi:hypothetical protein
MTCGRVRFSISVHHEIIVWLTACRMSDRTPPSVACAAFSQDEAKPIAAASSRVARVLSQQERAILSTTYPLRASDMSLPRLT